MTLIFSTLLPTDANRPTPSNELAFMLLGQFFEMKDLKSGFGPGRHRRIRQEKFESGEEEPLPNTPVDGESGTRVLMNCDEHYCSGR
jgi:hypothetical protein